MGPSINVVELHDQLPGQSQLVDVRSPSEFGSAHIPGAVNIPMDQIEVRLGAGLLVLAGAGLALTVNVNWLFLSAFSGLGLTFAGLTDICPMAEVLAKMPWNGRSQCNTAPRMDHSKDIE